MSYKYGFFDNQTIGVDDLNAIVSRFVTDGIAVNPKTVGDFSKFNAEISTKGVVPETVTSLKVYKDNGGLYISPGTAYFNNGTFIEITEPEMIEYTSGVINYIYLRSDAGSSAAYPVCSKTKNTSDDVLLAVLEKDGTVTDKRMYAKGKSPCYYSSSNSALELDAVFKKGSSVYEFDIGVNNYKNMVLVYKNDIGSTDSDGRYSLSFVHFNDDDTIDTAISYVKGITYVNGPHQDLAFDGKIFICHDMSLNNKYDNRVEAYVEKKGTKIIFTPTSFCKHEYSDVTVKMYMM